MYPGIMSRHTGCTYCSFLLGSRVCAHNTWVKGKSSQISKNNHLSNHHLRSPIRPVAPQVEPLCLFRDVRFHCQTSTRPSLCAIFVYCRGSCCRSTEGRWKTRGSGFTGPARVLADLLVSGPEPCLLLLPMPLALLRRHVYHMLPMFPGPRPRLNQGITLRFDGAKKHSRVLL